MDMTSSNVDDKNETKPGENSKKGSCCPIEEGELEWSKSLRGTLLGAYYYGYIITQVVGGVLEQKLGGKVVYGTGMLAIAVLDALGPVASRVSPWAMFAVRFSMGLVSGVLFPAMIGVWGRWAPPTERTRLLAISYIGLPVGNIINYPLASFLAAELGWETIFYIPGASVAAWLLVWLLLAYDSPAKHPRILEEEQKYIEDSIGVKVQQNGLLSALPYVLEMISMLTSSIAADRLIARGKIPKVWIRRGFAITGFSGMVICGVILANLSGCNPVAAVALLCLLQTFNALTTAGMRAVHVEFAPRFSGVTYALANTAGTLPGIFAPLLVGFITENDPTLGAWMKIFYIGAAIQGVGGIFTVVFMRTDVQPWALGDEEQDLVIANEHAEMPMKFVEMPSTKL
ncbi:SLC17A5 [Branchiostoma lanceolatum]|uniref:SLC17A5 protein n=1 Tax=Branchiostoma lanceolatum TaxID=7740 RepID=A0A8K0ESK8_BRALA|nr:SLC17A5 [Branchiostoma lanceolatum]